MNAHNRMSSSRRRFLQLLASSPLWRSAGASAVLLKPCLSSPRAVAEGSELLSPSDALDVFDFEAVTRKNLPPAHLAYLATGVESDATLRANREGFSKFQIRARRLVDTSRLDTRVELFGATWPSPIVLAPVSSQRAFNPEGEIATARAARAGNHLQILSTLTTASVEEVIAARGMPVWYQLYPTSDWNIARALVKRAESAGCPIVALTVDNPTSAGRETLAREQKLDRRDCATCHPTDPGGYFRRKPMFDGLDVAKLSSPLTDRLTWDFVRRLQDTTSMKIVLKGIVTAEDATLALRHRVDGVIVSNHGGRGEESARSTIESLPEVVNAIGGKIPVLVDSGFRRGTDIFKALALGAKAVCIGRPYIWGLAAFGQAGVERSLEILRTELEITMRSMGTPSLASITNKFVQHV
jgi:4-hydroxymandelate oxidase